VGRKIGKINAENYCYFYLGMLGIWGKFSDYFKLIKVDLKKK
jgi:hypothetical protein